MTLNKGERYGYSIKIGDGWKNEQPPTSNVPAGGYMYRVAR
jgi:hypothetical protein